MLIIIAVLVFLAAVFGAASLLFSYSSRLSSRGAALPYREMEMTEGILPQEMSKSLWQRALRPQLRALVGTLGNLMPAHWVERTQIRLERAGRPGGMSARSYLGLQVLIASLALLALFALLRFWPLPQRMATLMLVVGPLIATMIPNYLVDRIALARRTAVRRVLPDTIDLLVVSVEAGLSLDAAIRELVMRENNHLAQEIGRAQDEMRAGRTRQEAWRDMAERILLPELTTFVSAVCQGERLGASIGKVLRTHADAMRIQRALAIRELAAKIPVKMLFPMVFFIFPCLFVVMLGPGVVQVYRNFQSVLF